MSDTTKLTPAQSEDFRTWASHPRTAFEASYDNYVACLLAWRMLNGRPSDGAVG
jgi:hypothetical protein